MFSLVDLIYVIYDNKFIYKVFIKSYESVKVLRKKRSNKKKKEFESI